MYRAPERVQIPHDDAPQVIEGLYALQHVTKCVPYRIVVLEGAEEQSRKRDGEAQQLAGMRNLDPDFAPYAAIVGFRFARTAERLQDIVRCDARTVAGIRNSL